MKYSKSIAPVILAIGAILADSGLIDENMIGDWTASIVTLLAVFGVVLPRANNYDGKW